MRILFTGAGSFTGLAFVEALVKAGHEVVCPLRGNASAYSGLRQKRVDRVAAIARVVSGASFGSSAFLDLVREVESWDLLCHHASEVADYKSPDFNPFRALESNTAGLREVLDAFRKKDGQAVLLTGTIFEPDEGKGEEPLRAFSPYGLSKGLTWQVFRFYCGRLGLPLGKFVIPNPFGPWEEPRFTGYLMNAWKQGAVALVKTPDYIRDNIHADLLAAVYARFAGEVVSQKAGSAIKSNPSGYAESQKDFAERVAHEVRPRTGWSCALDFLAQQDFSEPMMRINSDDAPSLIPEWNERSAWDAFVKFYH